MAKLKKATELDLLRLFVFLMEKKGVTRNVIHLSADENMLDLIREQLNANCTLEELRQFADRCLAHQWLEYGFVSASKYESLVLTLTGYGVVRSLQVKETAKAKRSTLKKFSDLIEDHKGIAAAVGVLIAIVGILLKLGV